MAITVEMRTEVAQLYTALFGRAPDLEGLVFWTNLRGGGESLEDVADTMYATAPARAYFPAFLAHEEIIASFYLNVLGREADAEGLAFWTAELDAAGSTPGSVIVRMIAVVANYGGTHPAGLLSQQLFNNKVTVAQHYAESGGNIADATEILAGVTVDLATVTAALNKIDGVIVDVAAPVFASATVTGTTLVMTYTDANLLDSVHRPAASAFTVTVDGVARTVGTVAVNGDAKTVTLTLSSAVANGQVVTVAYTDPTSANDANAVQDVSGNDAATLAATAATNNTPDTTAPVFASAAVTGSSLVMTYTELNLLDATNMPSATRFAVKVDDVARTVSSVSVDADAKTVTLTLASAVINGQAVTVAYTDPAAGNDTNAIQDASGNDAATLAATAVTNSTADVLAPVFASASVSGTSLVMTYTELNLLNAANKAAPGAFAVKVDTVLRAVSTVTVDANAKTVTLTLATAVTEGQAVTVAYTDPTVGNDANAIQDASGNDAATFTATAVTNATDTTAPVFASANVNGTSLVMTYTELNLLNAANKAAPGAFSVKVDTVVRVVSAVTVDANAKTVTLTLASAVTEGQAVTVAYTDPTAGNDTNAIQDASGNDAATFVATPVLNKTDNTAPEFDSASVNGASLVMTYSELNLLNAANKAAAGAFAVTVGGAARAVSTVTVDANAKTVTLTLASVVTQDQLVTVAYTDPTAGNDLNAIQDASGNDAATFGATSVTNNTDNTAPEFVSATVDGTSLVMTYTELNLLNAANKAAPGAFSVKVDTVVRVVSAVTVDAEAKTVTLTLASAVTDGQAVTVAYTDPTVGNDTNAIQDASGNDAVTLGATTVANVDATLPVLAGAHIDGTNLVMTFTELNLLDVANAPGTGDFSVVVGAGAGTVNSVVVDANAKTVTLTLDVAVTNGQAVTVAYTDPTVDDDAAAIQDTTGNDAASFGPTVVTNDTVALLLVGVSSLEF